MTKEEMIKKWELKLHKIEASFMNSVNDKNKQMDDFYVGEINAIVSMLHDLRKLNVK